DVNEGALVLYVIPDSAAAMAGVQAHDVITAVNGEPVNTEVTLPDRLIAYEGGDIVQLTVQRGSDTMMIDATLANSPVAGLPYPIAPELGTNEARPNNG
ncbi:MAG: PDZ domain-containing protein, partial [Anaerolineae bacterium]|nr:PDZ domain-containing protein [Anaerolineae bacterium]